MMMVDTQCYRKKSIDDDFRKRSGSNGKKWNRKDQSGQLELRTFINPDLLKFNMDRHWFFEDEQVRRNGSVFAKRENFDDLLSVIPLSKFNGIHIKMEDDCPQGGDDVRLCLLKTLGAHNQRAVPCVGCREPMIVYDRYPLVDGTFFLSPVVHYGPQITVIYDAHKLFLQAMCARCLWSEWECRTCGNTEWFAGKSLLLGTLYTYDIISTGRCCPPTCEQCRTPLLIPDHVINQVVNGNYNLLNEVVCCAACGSKNHHLLRQMGDVQRV